MAQSITLQTSDDDVIASDVLGRLSFAASNDSSGGDAILIGGSIYAMAEATFSAVSNPTSIIFATASSESATPKLKIESQGHFVPINNEVYDLGTSSYRFRSTYSENIETDKIVFISGSVPPVSVDNSAYNVNGELFFSGSGVALLPSGGLENQILQKVNTSTNLLQWVDNYSTEVRVYVKNTTGSELTKGQAVYINSAQGDHPTIALAVASGESSSSKTLGLLYQNLAINEFGYVVAEGTLEGVDTSAAGQDGDLMYLSPTTPGGIVYGLANKPSAPNHLVFLGYVIVKQQNNGKVFVKVQNGFEIEELHNVKIDGVTNGQYLVYNATSGVWANATVNPGGGTTVANYADNRILTSDGTSTGINAESNLTFDGSSLTISSTTATVLNINASSSGSDGPVIFGKANSANEWLICSQRGLLGNGALGLGLYVYNAYPMSFWTNNSERMRIDSAGNVGIGSTSPTTLLHILGTGEGIHSGRVGGGRPHLRLQHANGTVASRTISANGNYVGQVSFEGYNGTSYMEHTGIFGIVNGTVTTTSIPTDLVFSAGSSGNIASNERMRITSAGNTEIRANAGNISSAFVYNENGGELVHYDETQTAATLLDQSANQTRLLELVNGSNLVLGLGSSNTTGSIVFVRAGYNEAMRIDSTGAAWMKTTRAWNDTVPTLNIGNDGDGRLQTRHIWGKAAGGTGTENLLLQFGNSGYHVQVGNAGQNTNLYVGQDLAVGAFFSGGTAGILGSSGYVYGKRFYNIDAASTDTGFGLYFNGSTDTAYAIYREAGAWTGTPYPDLRIAFHTGIKIGANATYNGVRFYTDYDMSSQVMSVNNASDGLGATNVYVNNSLQVDNTIVINRNIATPANYWNSLQMEIRATSGTAGISLHRSGYSHVGIYTDSANQLKFNMNAGTPVLEWNAGTILGTGNYNSYAPTLTGGGASGTWGINITGNAATVGSLSIHAGVNNEANKIVRTDGSGYLYTGWINTISGELGSPKPTRLYASTDAFIRYYPLATFKAHMGLTGKNVFSRAETTTDSNYWVGSMGWGNSDYNTVFSWGSGFTDVWDNPANQPPGTAHWQGIQALHYSNGTNTYGFQIACGAGNPDLLYVRGAWGGTPTSWRRIAAGDSRNTRGATRLYRNDSDTDYSVQTYWTGARWRLRGYAGDTYHAEAEVSYADSAGNAATVTNGLTTTNYTAYVTPKQGSVNAYASFNGSLNPPTFFGSYNIASVIRATGANAGTGKFQINLLAGTVTNNTYSVFNAANAGSTFYVQSSITTSSYVIGVQNVNAVGIWATDVSTCITGGN